MKVGDSFFSDRYFFGFEQVFKSGVMTGRVKGDWSLLGAERLADVLKCLLNRGGYVVNIGWTTIKLKLETTIGQVVVFDQSADTDLFGK